MTQTRNLEGIIIVLKQQKSWSEKDPMNKLRQQALAESWKQRHLRSEKNH